MQESVESRIRYATDYQVRDEVTASVHIDTRTAAMRVTDSPVLEATPIRFSVRSEALTIALETQERLRKCRTP